MKFNQFDGSELAINELLPTIFCIIISFIFHSERQIMYLQNLMTPGKRTEFLEKHI